MSSQPESGYHRKNLISRLFRGLAAYCLSLAIFMAAPSVFADGDHHNHDRISRARAESIALDQAPPHGVIRESELVTVDGRTVWSVTVVNPRFHRVTRVRVSARSGRVISVTEIHRHR